MSNTHLSARRLARWFLINLFVAATLCALTGRYRDPWLWTYIATIATIGLLPTLWLDDDLAKERFNPPEPGADRRPLAAIRFIVLLHIVVSLSGPALADQPRTGRRSVARTCRPGISIGLFFHAMMANRFFSAVIRIQKDRGHHLIDQGPLRSGSASRIRRHDPIHGVQRPGPRIVARVCDRCRLFGVDDAPRAL